MGPIVSGCDRHVVPHRPPSKSENFVFFECELAGLPLKSQSVLRLRVGLIGEKKHTLDEVGERLGISRERARQIQSAALTSLRRQRPVGHPLARLETRGGAGREAESKGASWVSLSVIWVGASRVPRRRLKNANTGYH